MANPIWPLTLPTIPLREGTQIVSLYQEPIQTEMEDGPVRRRRRSTSTWSEVALRFALTHAQWATFQTFVRDTLGHGSAAFDMPVWRPGAGLSAPVKTVKLADKISHEITVPFIYVTLPLLVRDF